jgi:hypothetical protein
MPNPFNISFEIPPLPKLGFGLPEDDKEDNNTQNKEFNFFTYL